MEVGSVSDVIFSTTVNGYVVPTLKVQLQNVVIDIPIPNVHALQQSKVWIGDAVEVDVGSQPLMWRSVVGGRSVDSTPTELPTLCPSCGEELHIYLERRLLVLCDKRSTCKAQNVG